MTTLNLSNIDRTTFGIADEAESAVDLLREAQNGQVKFTYREALSENPDEFARLSKLSKESGVPLEVVRGGEKEIETDLKLNQINFEDMSQRRPGTTKFLTDFNNAVIAQDDVEVLGAIEDAFQGLKHVAGQFTRGASSIISGSVKSVGIAMNQPDQELLEGFQARLAGDRQPMKSLFAEPIDAVRQVMFAFSSRERQEQIVDDLLRASGTHPRRLELEQQLVTATDPEQIEAIEAELEEYASNLERSSVYQMGQAIDDWVKSVTYTDPEIAEMGGVAGFFLNDVAEAFGSIAGIYATAVLTRGVAGRAAPGMTAAESTFVGGALPGAAVNYAAQFEQAVDEGATLQEAYQVAGIAKYIGMTEGLPVMDFLGRVDKASGGLIKNAIKNILIQGTEEAIQEGFTEIANALTRHAIYDAEGGFWSIVDDTAHSGAVGFTTGALLEFFAQTLLPGRRRRTAADSLVESQGTLEQRGEAEQDILDGMHDLFSKSETRKRNIDAFMQFVRDSDGDSDTGTHVFIDSAQASLYLQENRDKVPNDLALQLLEEYVESASGADAAIPVEQFAAYFAGSEHFAALRDSMTLSAETIPPFRQEQARQETASFIDKLIAEQQENVSEYVESQEIFESVRQQLVDTGMVTPQNADVMAQLVPAYFTRFARENGISLQEAYQRSGLVIEGPQTGRLEELERQASEVLTQAREQGYEGESMGEALEWRRAYEKFGPEGMTQEARLAQFAGVNAETAVKQSNIDGPRQARLAADFAAGNWRTSDQPVNRGGVSPQEFTDAIQNSDAYATLTPYTVEELKAGIKAGTMRLFQLGQDGQIFFMLETRPDGRVELASVVNNEQGARGIGAPAVLLKAIEEGATDLTAFAVVNDKYPAGFLPTLYESFGFVVTNRMEFDVRYFRDDLPKRARDRVLQDAVKYWTDSTPGFNPDSGMPSVVEMTWRGTDADRASIRERYFRGGLEGLLAGRADADAQAATAQFDAPDQQATQEAGSAPDAGRATGNQGAGNRPPVPYRAQRVVAGIAELNDTELRNLGLTTADRDAARAATGSADARSSLRGSEQAGDRGGRVASRSLAPLPDAPSVPGFSGPDPRLVDVAEQYARANGIDLRRQSEYVDVDPARAARIADAYEAMPHAPQDPAVREAYENLIRQTRAQYDALVAAGYQFWFVDPSSPEGAAYLDSPWNAMRDLRENQSMGSYPTDDGFGSGDFNPEANPLLADTGIQWPVGSPDGQTMKPVFANDLFRVVHDAFGHGLEGAGFRARGEENAWQAHVRLFTGSAVGAITSETRGQNSWLNYGPHGERNRTARVEDTIFADQKTGLMPEWTWTEGRAGDMPAEPRFDPTDPRILFQGVANRQPRGYYDPANSVIRLTEAANLSTFLHEFAHFIYEMELTNDGKHLSSIHEWFKRNADAVAKEASGYLGQADGPVEQRDPVILTDEGDVSNVVTGQPVSFHFIHNTESATKLLGRPKKDSPYGRYHEPSGRYVNVSSAEMAGGVQAPLTGGQITLRNPLVMDNDGLQWKKTLSDQYGGKRGKALSKAIIADGYDGVITLDGNYISEVVEFTSFDEAKALFQDQDLPDFRVPPPASVTADDVILYLDNQTTGDQSKDRAIRRAVHEQFARGFEQYLMEGKAPSVELRSAFRTFARWLTQIYQNIRNALRVNLDDEMRQTFDRLIATEEQIAAAEARAQYRPMFTDAAVAGMTEAEWQQYQEQQNNVKGKQEETLRDQLIHELRRQMETWWKEEKADIVDEEVKRLRNEQVYRAIDILRGSDPESDVNLKLDHAIVKELAGEQRVDRRGRKSTHIPSALRGMTITGARGVHPDEAAAFLGYNSGEEMIAAITAAPPIREAAESNAEAIMIERHGDTLRDGTIEQRADEALQNEERGKLLLTELKALSRGRRTPLLDRQAIKAMAQESVGKLPFRQIHPGKYRKAEIRAAQDAATALANGDKAAAAAAKSRQVMNFYLGMAATEARNETMKIVDRMARYNKKSVREEIQKAENGYWEQIVKILNRFEFRQSATLRSVDETNQDINTWMRERVEIDGDALVLTPAVLNESYVTHWKNVPFADLQGVNDSVRNLEHVARYANKLTRMGEEIEFKKLVQRWVDNIKSTGKPDRFRPQRTDAVEGRKFGRWAMAQMSKIGWMASWMDGGERVGMSHQILVQPINDAFDAEMRLWSEVGKPVMEAILNRSKADLKRHNRKIYIPEIKDDKNDGNLKGHQILAVALNVGNQGNLRKMLLGEGWAHPDFPETISIDNPKLQAVLKHMTKSDWDLVQMIWNQMEELYPQLAETHRRTTGLTPPKVDATPVKTPYGEYRGGYYPVKYDPNRSHRAQLDEDRLNAETDSMFSNGSSIQASVNASATNERTGYYAPIRLSLDVVPNHFQEVIHYITHHDAVREINKLIRNEQVADAIKGKLGPEEFAQLKPWLNDIAKDGRNSPSKTFIDSAFQRLRFGTTLGIMGFKASTGIIQTLGLFNTAAEVGAGPTLKAVFDTLGPAAWTRAARKVLGSESDVQGAWEFAVENSKIMAHRAETMDREIKHAFQRLEGKRGILPAVQEASMKHIALIQTYMVDLPTWHAAYGKSLSEHGDEQRAFQYADWVVENLQGSGNVKDLSALLRNQSKTHTTFTMFMTFFSSLWNMERDLVKGSRSGQYSPTTVAAKMMFMFTLPVLAEMLYRGDFWDEDDELREDAAEQALTALALYPIQSIPFVRDVANATIGEYGYDATPVAAVMERGLQGLSNTSKRAFTDDEITKAQVKDASALLGAAFGIPGIAQAWATGEHLYEVMEEGEDLAARQLLFGPRRD